MVTFPEAKEAVIKAFSPIGEPGPFDNYYGDEVRHTDHVTQADVNSGLLYFFNQFKQRNAKF